MGIIFLKVANTMVVAIVLMTGMYIASSIVLYWKKVICE